MSKARYRKIRTGVIIKTVDAQSCRRAKSQ